MTATAWLEPHDWWAWRRRLELERKAGHLTLHRQHALATLLTFGALEGAEGLFASDAAVAERAGCCARTVRRARADARELGLLTWQRTRKVVDGQWRQGANRYAIAVPARPVCTGPGGQGVPRRQKVSSKGLSRGGQVATFGPPGSLPSTVEMSQASQARFLAAYAARRSAGGS